MPALLRRRQCSTDAQQPPRPTAPDKRPDPRLETEIDRLLKTGNMQYRFNVDVTSFSAAGRKRVNHNFNGDAEPEEEAGGWFAVSLACTGTQRQALRPSCSACATSLAGCPPPSQQPPRWRMRRWCGGGTLRAALCASCTRSASVTRCGIWWVLAAIAGTGSAGWLCKARQLPRAVSGALDLTSLLASSVAGGLHGELRRAHCLPFSLAHMTPVPPVHLGRPLCSAGPPPAPAGVAP